jgi:hypothetical protein
MKSKLKLLVYNLVGLGIFLFIDYFVGNEYVFEKSIGKAIIMLFLFNVLEFIIRRKEKIKDFWKK